VSAFAKLDAEGRPPEGILLEGCRRTSTDYGLLASGTRLRLFEAAPESGSAIARYLERRRSYAHMYAHVHPCGGAAPLGEVDLREVREWAE
jgi:hypothetical protein